MMVARARMLVVRRVAGGQILEISKAEAPCGESCERTPIIQLKGVTAWGALVKTRCGYTKAVVCTCNE